jgi:Holliday junction resolvase RusA-like endonuclease
MNAGTAVSAQEVCFVVPMIPDSVNTYTRHAKGRHFKSDRARAFEHTMPLFVRGAHVVGTRFSVSLRFVLGPKQHPDIDNLAKQVLDSLADCGVFRSAAGKFLSDNSVKRLTMEIDDEDRKNPRTEIIVRALK